MAESRVGDPKKTILIADDEEDVRLLVEMTLEDSRYHILTAVDGQAALEQIRRVHPDLVILDWMMPGLNGFEIMTQLRQDQDTAGIQVLLLTANDCQEDKAQAQALGVVAYLEKPFSPLELLQKVRESMA